MRALPLLLLAACSEYTVREDPPPPPADPPGDVLDAQGDPPSDWNGCASGHFGLYFNVTADHPDLEPPEDDPLLDLDGWDAFDEDRLAFQRYDPSLDFGANWWPVDEGLTDDPAYFAVQWTSWLRVLENTTLSFVLGAADDATVWIDGDPAFVLTNATYEPQAFTLDMRPGQYPVRIRYANRRAAENGFRFRLTGGDGKICYPEFDQD